jgi:hypothetical protein
MLKGKDRIRMNEGGAAKHRQIMREKVVEATINGLGILDE